MAVSATAGKKETQFLWEGKDKRGNKVRGKSLAANEAALRADLRRQGVAATKVKTPSSIRGGGKVQPMDIAVFARQLATMMSAGIPMVQAFEIIGNGHEKPAMQKLVLDIKGSIEGGSTLHESLAKHPLYFDDLFVNLVTRGRTSRCAGDPAGQNRHLQGKNRSPEEENQKGDVLSRGGFDRCRHCDRDIADFRHSAVRVLVQGIWRGSAGVHANGREHVEVHAASGLDRGTGGGRRHLRVHVFP